MIVYCAATALIILGVYFVNMAIGTMASALDPNFIVFGANIPNAYIGPVIFLFGVGFFSLGVRAFFNEWRRSR